MIGQIGEYISNNEIKDWTELQTLVTWKSGVTGFESGKRYSIYNNSPTTLRFIATDSADSTMFGSIFNQGSIIYYRPDTAEKLFIKGLNFNLVISEI